MQSETKKYEYVEEEEIIEDFGKVCFTFLPIAQPSKCQVEQHLWLALYLVVSHLNPCVTPCKSQTEQNRGYEEVQDQA